MSESVGSYSSSKRHSVSSRSRSSDASLRGPSVVGGFTEESTQELAKIQDSQTEKVSSTTKEEAKLAKTDAGSKCSNNDLLTVNGVPETTKKNSTPRRDLRDGFKSASGQEGKGGCF